MKIPDYLREPCLTPGVVGLDYVARILQIEAFLYRQGGQREAAVALANTAKMLKRIEVGSVPADVFDWPPQPQSGKAPL